MEDKFLEALVNKTFEPIRLETFKKGRRGYPIGTVTTWGNQKMKKTPTGWIPLEKAPIIKVEEDRWEGFTKNTPEKNAKEVKSVLGKALEKVKEIFKNIPIEKISEDYNRYYNSAGEIWVDFEATRGKRSVEDMVSALEKVKQNSDFFEENGIRIRTLKNSDSSISLDIRFYLFEPKSKIEVDDAISNFKKLLEKKDLEDD